MQICVVMMKRKIIIEVMAGLLVLLWVYAALSKLFDHKLFLYQLGKAPIIKSYAGFLSFAIPSIELILSLLLVLPRTRRYGFLGSALLLVSFNAYLVASMISGSRLPCSCGGVISELSWEGHIAFNSFFLLIAIAAILLIRSLKIIAQDQRSGPGVLAGKPKPGRVGINQKHKT